MLCHGLERADAGRPTRLGVLLLCDLAYGTNESDRLSAFKEVLGMGRDPTFYAVLDSQHTVLGHENAIAGGVE